MLFRVKNNRLYLDNVEVSSYANLESQINKCNLNIEKIKSEIKQLIAATPKDLITNIEEQGEPLIYVNERFSELYEDLDNELYNLHSLYIAQNVLDDWLYSDPFETDNLIEKLNVKDNKDFDFLTYKKDEKKLTLADVGIEVKEGITIENILSDVDDSFNRTRRDEILNFWYLTYKGKIFIDDNNNFMFKSEAAAKEEFYRKINICLFNYTNLDFIKKNELFINELIKISKDSKDEEYNNKFLNLYNKIKNAETIKDIEFMELSEFYEMLHNLVKIEIEKNIKILKFN